MVFKTLFLIILCLDLPQEAVFQIVWTDLSFCNFSELGFGVLKPQLMEPSLSSLAALSSSAHPIFVGNFCPKPFYFLLQHLESDLNFYVLHSKVLLVYASLADNEGQSVWKFSFCLFILA